MILRVPEPTNKHEIPDIASNFGTRMPLTLPSSLPRQRPRKRVPSQGLRKNTVQPMRRAATDFLGWGIL